MQPHVGIFFLCDDQLHIESTPLSRAETYGTFLGFAGGHDAMFDRLIEAGKVPSDLEYQDVPRGRVVYSVPNGEYIVYLDPCIRRRPETVKQVIECLNLPQEKCKLAGDAHYRCAACGPEKK